MILEEVWALAVTLFLSVVPGLVVLAAARLRGWVLVAAPLVTYGIVTFGSAVATWTGLPWTIWSLTLYTLVLVAVAVSVSQFVPQLVRPAHNRDGLAEHDAGPEDRAVASDTSRARPNVIVAVCAAVGGLFGVLVIRRGMGSLDAIHQDWDAVFHGAAVRWIIEAEDMSQGSLAQLNNRESVDTFYYPDAWHGLAALGWDLGVDSVPQILNAGALIVPIFLAFGIAALVMHLTRNSIAAGAAAILVSLPSALVFDLLWRGPLIPYAVGLSLVPALVLLFRHALTARSTGLLLATGLAAGGVVGVHPSGVYTALIFLVPWMLQRWILDRRLIGGDLLAILGIGLVAGVVAAASLLAAFSANTGARQDWPAVESAGQAAGEALLLNHARVGPQWAVAVLAALGATRVGRYRELWWFWVSGAIALVLFIAAAAYDSSWAADLTAPWWNDRWRFAAMVALFVCVAAGFGVALVVSTLHRFLRGRTALPATASALVTVIVVGVALGVVTKRGYGDENSARIAINYEDGRVITEDDLELWRLASEIVPEGQFVMNDPTDGSTWMFATEGLRPYFGGMTLDIPGQTGMTDDQETLLSRFDEIVTDAEVRSVVADAGIEYVIVGDGYIHGMSAARGVDDLEDNRAFELVEQVGGSQLFRIVD